MSAVRTSAGHVLSVQSRELGSALDGDQSAGATVLTVQDCSDFDDMGAGGQITLNDVTYTYSDVDDDASTLAISPALTADASDGDQATILDPILGSPQYTTTAAVTEDGEDPGDPIEADVASALVGQLIEGVRGAAGESVTLTWDENGDATITALEGLNTDQAGFVRWMQDYATATGNTDVTIKLTYQPVPDTSVKVSWGGVGLNRDEWDFTDPWTIVVPAQGFHADDSFEAHYAYTDPATRPVVPASLSLIGYTTATAGGAVALPAGTEAGHLIVIAGANYAPSAAPATTDARILVQHHDVNTSAIGGAPNGGGVLAAYGVEDGSGTAVTVTSTGDTAIILAVFAYTGALDSLWIALRDAVADGHDYAVALPSGADMGIALLAGQCGTVSAPFDADTSGDWSGVAFETGVSVSKATVYVAYTTGPHDGLFGGLSTPSIWSAMSIGIEEG